MKIDSFVNKVHLGDCREVLREMPRESVDCVLFSPPYYGLREYGAKTIWGGKKDCKHRWIATLSGEKCEFCGAWRGELGQENTPFEYVDHLTEICKEVKRVLKPTGSLFIVIGDTFYSRMKGQNIPSKWHRFERLLVPGMKLGVPFLLRFALNEIGFVSRDDCIWKKRNPIPSSQLSRFTNIYEFVFHFVKNSGKTLVWRNMLTGEWIGREPEPEYYNADTGEIRNGRPPKEELYVIDPTGVKRRVWFPVWRGFDYYFELDPVRIKVVPEEFAEGLKLLRGLVAKELYKTKYKPGMKAHARTLRMAVVRAKSRELAPQLFPDNPEKQREFIRYVHDHSTHPLGKNPGDVWEIATEPTLAGHLAPFPLELCKIPILTTCPKWVCYDCGAPVGSYTTVTKPKKCTTCNSTNINRGIVLDIFCGSGSALVAAKKLGRNYIGIEIVKEYVEIAKKRLSETPWPLERFL
ncbi:MAG TPA: site-specific DNA-methyltransferase [Thermococcus sp.]|nr:site-specific DNA-methyltransferase [Thermococcus sp.]